MTEFRYTPKLSPGFWELLRAGLWGTAVHPLALEGLDFNRIYQIAQEQSVVGIISAGIDWVQKNELIFEIPSEVLFQFIGDTIKLEQRNKSMNFFVAELIKKLRTKGVINVILLKGQGIAQCYEQPLWRSSGDVDLLLNEEDFSKSRAFLTQLASHVETENTYEQHLAMTIDSWIVELHGNLRSGLSRRIDTELDEIKKESFNGRAMRTWVNDDTQVQLLKLENDAIYVFTHILGHFYKGGIGLRQLCDWCRLLWAYKDSIDLVLLESRIRKMNLMTEWKAFGALAVEYLGMPVEAMPFFDARYRTKGDHIMSFVLEVGNFGHNRDMSYYNNYPFLLRKAVSFLRRCGDLIRHARVFPIDSLRFFPFMLINGLSEAVKGK